MIINKKWYLTSDELNVKIYKVGTVAAKGHFSTPKAALRWLVNNEILGTGMADLETVVAKIDELRNDIEGMEI